MADRATETSCTPVTITTGMSGYWCSVRSSRPKPLNTAVRFINLSQVVLEKDLDAVLEEITKEVEKASPGVVVVDSFRTVVRKALGGTTEVELQSFIQLKNVSARHLLRAVGSRDAIHGQASNNLSVVLQTFISQQRTEEDLC